METYREGIYVRKEGKRIKEAIQNMWRVGILMKRFYFLSIYAILVLNNKGKDRESERERLIWSIYGTATKEGKIGLSLRARATTCERVERLPEGQKNCSVPFPLIALMRLSTLIHFLAVYGVHMAFFPYSLIFIYFLFFLFFTMLSLSLFTSHFLSFFLFC